MQDSDRRELVSLVRERSLAALGTILDGGPLVSMVLYASEPDVSCLYIHVSRLAQHTRGLLSYPRGKITRDLANMRPGGSIMRATGARAVRAVTTHGNAAWIIVVAQQSGLRSTARFRAGLRDYQRNREVPYSLLMTADRSSQSGHVPRW